MTKVADRKGTNLTFSLCYSYDNLEIKGYIKYLFLKCQPSKC